MEVPGTCYTLQKHPPKGPPSRPYPLMVHSAIVEIIQSASNSATMRGPSLLCTHPFGGHIIFTQWDLKGYCFSYNAKHTFLPTPSLFETGSCYVPDLKHFFVPRQHFSVYPDCWNLHHRPSSFCLLSTGTTTGPVCYHCPAKFLFCFVFLASKFVMHLTQFPKC